MRAGSARLPALFWNTYSGVEPASGDAAQSVGLPRALQRAIDGAVR